MRNGTISTGEKCNYCPAQFVVKSLEDCTLCPICNWMGKFCDEQSQGERIDDALDELLEKIDYFLEYCSRCNIVYSKGCQHSSDSYYAKVITSFKYKGETYFGMPVFESLLEFIYNFDDVSEITWKCLCKLSDSLYCPDSHRPTGVLLCKEKEEQLQKLDYVFTYLQNRYNHVEKGLKDLVRSFLHHPM